MRGRKTNVTDKNIGILFFSLNLNTNNIHWISDFTSYNEKNVNFIFYVIIY